VGMDFGLRPKLRFFILGAVRRSKVTFNPLVYGIIMDRYARSDACMHAL
jgi:hypothetical protein